MSSKITINRPACYIDHVYRSSTKKPCGYCWNKIHRGLLSVKLLKKHKCLQKHCEFLQKYEDHEFWINRERIQQLRKERKKRYYGY